MNDYRIITNGYEFGVQHKCRLFWKDSWCTVTDGAYYAMPLRFKTKAAAQQWIDGEADRLERLEDEERRKTAKWVPV